GQELLGDRATSPATDQLLDRLGFRLAYVGASTLEHRPGDGVDVPPGDRLVVDDGDGGTHVTVDHGGGVLEEVQVVAPPLGEGDHQGGAAGPPAGPAGPLHVVGSRRGDVAHEHRLHLADVDAELERRRATERVDLAPDEP